MNADRKVLVVVPKWDYERIVRRKRKGCYISIEEGNDDLSLPGGEVFTLRYHRFPDRGHIPYRGNKEELKGFLRSLIFQDLPPDQWGLLLLAVYEDSWLPPGREGLEEWLGEEASRWQLERKIKG